MPEEPSQYSGGALPFIGWRNQYRKNLIGVIIHVLVSIMSVNTYL